jgi:hypothetical protein
MGSQRTELDMTCLKQFAEVDVKYGRRRWNVSYVPFILQLRIYACLHVPNGKLFDSS